MLTKLRNLVAILAVTIVVPFNSVSVGAAQAGHVVLNQAKPGNIGQSSSNRVGARQARYYYGHVTHYGGWYSGYRWAYGWRSGYCGHNYYYCGNNGYRAWPRYGYYGRGCRYYYDCWQGGYQGYVVHMPSSNGWVFGGSNENYENPDLHYSAEYVYENTYDHVQWCLTRYRSYVPRTDTFLGYDGRRHLCVEP